MKDYKWFCTVYSAMLDYINFAYAVNDRKQVDYINQIILEFFNTCKKQHGKYPRYIERRAD